MVQRNNSCLSISLACVRLWFSSQHWNKKHLKSNSKIITQFENGQNICTVTLPKKIDRWEASIWNDAQSHVALWNYKLKQQWDTTMFPVLWLKLRRRKTPENTKYCQGCKAKEIFILHWSEVKMLLWNTVWQFLTKLNKDL